MKKTNSYTYRKIYENHYGPIPHDECGRSYEIHHIDGNRENNTIDNLECITIQEHYDRHYSNGDYGACVMIAKRMAQTPEQLSEIQKGCKRPGVGGVPKGTIPWNKGKSGYKVNMTESGIRKKRDVIETRARIQPETANKIRNDFEQRVEVSEMEKIGITKRNGKKMSYERLFCNDYAQKHNVTPQYIFRIIRGLSRNDV